MRSQPPIRGLESTSTWRGRAAGLLAILAAGTVGFGASAEATSPLSYKAKDGTTRTAKFTTSTASLYFDKETTPWFGKYTEKDSGLQYASGLSAARNLLYWFGADAEGKTLWTTLAQEMRLNKGADGFETAAGCVGGCTATCMVDPACLSICTAGCAGAVSAIGIKGVRMGAFVQAMQAHAPPGYKVAFRSNGGRLKLLVDALKEGGPVAVLLNSGNHMNRYTLVTQVTTNDKGQAYLSLADQGSKEVKVSWDDFVQTWSLRNFGDDPELFALERVFGERPFFMAYYAKATGRDLGDICFANTECGSGACDAHLDGGCVPTKGGNLGDFCTNDAQCGSARCERSAPPKITTYGGNLSQTTPGSCTKDDLPLGEACPTHQSCHSGRCDTQPRSGCVQPDGRGAGGDYCSTHQQCKSGYCNVTSKPRGTCEGTGLDLGDRCHSHASCGSKRCDDRSGAGCVAADGRASTGNFCTTHQQCRSGYCYITSGIAGRCKIP